MARNKFLSALCGVVFTYFSQCFLTNCSLTGSLDVLQFLSSSVKQLILDAKVGPPSYEKGLAKDILSVVSSFSCKKENKINVANNLSVSIVLCLLEFNQSSIFFL